MKASLFIGTSAYAMIKTPDVAMDIRLEPGRSASQSLLETAAGWRADAERLVRNAALAEQASALLAKD